MSAPDGFCSCGMKYAEIEGSLLCPRCDRETVEAYMEAKCRDDLDRTILEMHKALQRVCDRYVGKPVSDYLIRAMQQDIDDALCPYLPIVVPFPDGVWEITGAKVVEADEGTYRIDLDRHPVRLFH